MCELFIVGTCWFRYRSVAIAVCAREAFALRWLMKRFVFGLLAVLGALTFVAPTAHAQYDDEYDDGRYDDGSYDDTYDDGAYGENDDYYEDSGPYDEDTYYGDDERDYRGGDISIFQSSLSPHGRWVTRAPFGRIWIPNVGRSWRPYTVGHWSYTSRYGWYWDSYEPWGWATFHYGWWDYDPGYGWYWVPGYVWSPAWVSWRWGNDSIGWAPILASIIWGDSYSDIFIHHRRSPRIDRRDSWCFVSTRDFGERHLDRRIAPTHRNGTFFNNTKVINNVRVENNRFFNRGVDVGEVERRSGRRFRRTEVRDVNKPGVGTPADGNTVNVFRPIRTPANTDRPFTGNRRGRNGNPAGNPDVNVGPGQRQPGAGDAGERGRRRRDNTPSNTESAPAPAQDGTWPGRGRRNRDAAPSANDQQNAPTVQQNGAGDVRAPRRSTPTQQDSAPAGQPEERRVFRGNGNRERREEQQEQQQQQDRPAFRGGQRQDTAPSQPVAPPPPPEPPPPPPPPAAPPPPPPPQQEQQQQQEQQPAQQEERRWFRDRREN